MSRKRQSICVVTWNDAHGGEASDGWHQWQPKKHHRPRKILSVGIVLREDKLGITLAQNKDRSAGVIDHTIFIPTGCIVEIMEVEV